MTTITASEAQDAKRTHDLMVAARDEAITTRTATTVLYWDATSDPANPGWMLRTYDPDGDYTEEVR